MAGPLCPERNGDLVPQLIVALTTLVGALCVPSLAFATISKYHVPAASPVIVWLVAVGSVIVTDWVSAVGLVP